MIRFTTCLIAIFIIASLTISCSDAGDQQNQVRIGQAAPTLSFLPLWSARALDSFEDQGLDLQFISIRGGDSTALAALNSGDIDFAAVGSTTALEAIARGQPFEMIYALMSEVSLELVVSNAFIAKTGVDPTDTLPERIAALKDAVIGVSAVGGAQDRAVRWLVEQGGLDPRRDIKVAQIGPPPALQAALGEGQIDGFILSPPEGMLAAESGDGTVLVRLSAEFPDLRALPYMVLVAKTPLEGAHRDLAVVSVRALQTASAETLADRERVGGEIQRKFYPKLESETIVATINALSAGISTQGRITQDDVSRLLSFTVATSGGAAPQLSSSDTFWTSDIVDAALAGN